jgi:hypothetical protein
MSTNTKRFLDEAGLMALWAKIKDHVKNHVDDSNEVINNNIQEISTQITRLEQKIENVVPGESVFNDVVFDEETKEFKAESDGQGPVRSSIIANALNTLSTEFNNTLKNDYYTKKEVDDKFLETDDTIDEDDIVSLFK